MGISLFFVKERAREYANFTLFGQTGGRSEVSNYSASRDSNLLLSGSNLDIPYAR